YYDPIQQVWVDDFFMAPINMRTVHATNALLNYPYGKAFIYKEKQVMSSAAAAYLSRLAKNLFFGALFYSWTRYLLTEYILPKPGEGLSVAQQEKGFYIL